MVGDGEQGIVVGGLDVDDRQLLNLTRNRCSIAPLPFLRFAAITVFGEHIARIRQGGRTEG